ncbi:PucR family transcriptional regulator [Streptomyces gardneri]|uniref:PucR family transcriptional regulator n=1 Tax=Streptomyces gardneri TaxID=66892 RepID=UPI0036C51990
MTTSSPNARGPGKAISTPFERHEALQARIPQVTVGIPVAPTGILRDTAAQLRWQVGTLADRSMGRVRTEIPYYSSAILAPADFTESAHVAIELAVASLADPDRFHESGEYAWSVGSKRATEGTPMLVVLQAYRIGVAVLWDRLVEAALAGGPEQAQPMLRAASDFWRFAARDTTLMMEAHRQALEGAAPDEGRKLLPVLKALLRGHTDPVDVSATAVAFDLPVAGRYAVARLEGRRTARRPDAPVREVVDGITLHWCPQGDGHLVVAILGDLSLDSLAAVLPSGPGVRGGISPAVTGLAQIGHARELADLALGTTARDGEVVLLDDRMSTAFLLARPDLATGITAKVLGPVLALDHADRSALLDTLQAWFDCEGATDRASEVLYCHRNTVLNRLRRLERVTGRRLDRPRDLVDLGLALEAYRRATGTH